jgi:hypothetical protein
MGIIKVVGLEVTTAISPHQLIIQLLDTCHIQESLQAELRRNYDHTLHGCCLMSARILCTRLRF